MEVVCSSEMLVHLYRTTGCHIPFDSRCVCPKCQKWKKCSKLLNTDVAQDLILGGFGLNVGSVRTVSAVI